MITIPVIPPIQEDELLYGYLMRLQKANEFPFMRPFINTFIAPDSTASERLRRLPEYSLLRDFENICCVTNRESKKKRDISQFRIVPFLQIVPDQRAAGSNNKPRIYKQLQRFFVRSFFCQNSIQNSLLPRMQAGRLSRMGKQFLSSPISPASRSRKMPETRMPFRNIFWT